MWAAMKGDVQMTGILMDGRADVTACEEHSKFHLRIDTKFATLLVVRVRDFPLV